MLLRWIGVGFVSQHFQGSNQLKTCASRVDNVVNVTLASGYIGVGKLASIIGYQFSACLFWIFRLIDGILKGQILGSLYREKIR